MSKAYALSRPCAFVSAPAIVRGPGSITSWPRSPSLTCGLRRLLIVALGADDLALRRGDIHRLIELEPGGLGVGDVDGPGDLGVLGRDLAHHLAVRVEAVEAEPRRLALDAALAIAEAIGVDRLGPRDFRAEEELIRAIAHPRDPDRRIDGDAHDLTSRRHGQVLIRGGNIPDSINTITYGRGPCKGIVKPA